MKVPKIWRVCLTQLSKGYEYSTVNISNVIKYPKYFAKKNYKIVVVRKYYGNSKKIIIFKKMI
jgi:hypothetical protein